MTIPTAELHCYMAAGTFSIQGCNKLGCGPISDKVAATVPASLKLPSGTPSP